MSIDWFTVAAQALNFLVLVWLLKRFLYKPVLEAIDARGTAIARTITEAQAQKAAADQARQEYADKSAALDAARAALLAQAVGEAKTERERLFGEAQAAADALRVKQEAAAVGERVRLGQDLYALAQTEVLAIAAKVLDDLAGISLEERMQEVFEQRLGGMDAAARQALKVAIDSAPQVLVRSTCEIPLKRRETLQKVLDEASSGPTVLQFVTSTGPGCGIELLVGGHKIAWSLADYLAELEGKVTALAGSAAPPAAPQAAASPA